MFSPQFAAANIGSPTVSLLYGIATLASGSLLFWLGGAKDQMPLRLVIVAHWRCLLPVVFAAATETGMMLLAAFFLLRLLARAC